MIMTTAEKVEKGLNWFKTLTEQNKELVVRQLLEYAIDTEWINVWSEQDAAELAEESERSIEHYQAPYFTTCGEPLDFNG